MQAQNRKRRSESESPPHVYTNISID